MFSYSQAIIFGALQGITELFPISSLGHSVILPKLIGWHIPQNDPFFLTFLVATHSTTALVLFGFFFDDWKKIIYGIFRSIRKRQIDENDKYAKLGWLLVIGTVPAGILGILFQEEVQTLFSSPRIVAAVLILNGLLLFGAEQLKKRNINEKETERDSDKRIARLSFFSAIKVGIFQSLALIPGFSRTGSSIVGGLWAGLSHEDSARYAFLLATPIIAAASILKIPEVFTTSQNRYILQIFVGSLTSGLAAYFSVKFLTRYFETKKLTPFAFYCVILGFSLSILFFLR